MKETVNYDRRADTITPRWPNDPTPPADENLTIIFDGLMGFCYNSDGLCEIGINRGRGKHRLEMNVFTKFLGNPACVSFPAFNPAQILSARRITVEILDQDPAVSFFHLGDFNRTTGHPKDFAWMLDMEKDFHPGGVDFVPNFFQQKIFVKQGKFHTRQLTLSTFDRIEDPNDPTVGQPLPLGKMARLTAAAVHIPIGGYASVTVDNLRPLLLPGIPLVTYEIDFSNECFEAGSRCQFPHPADPHEEVRNDFFAHYDAFQPKSGHAKYGLIVHNQSHMEPPLNKCFEGTILKDNTDEAPCMATGYGQTGGFPPP